MRIALARAIYNNGDIILMDEPFSALDDDLNTAVAIAVLLEMVKEVNKAKGNDKE